jgi:hypothetical protein
MFFLQFLLDDRRIRLMIEGSGFESISLTNGSGCGAGRPKNIWMIGSRSATLLSMISTALIYFSIVPVQGEQF